jgi:hypothetical protein
MRRRAVGQFLRAGPVVVSRRRFFGMGAGAAGGVLGSGLWTPALGEHDDDDRDRDRDGRPCPEQNPIPHVNMAAGPQTFGAFHFFFPGPVDGSPAATDPEPQAAHAAGRDPSLIFDFDGVVGQADLNLTGVGTDTTTGSSAPYGFHTDMRFMAGRFVGTDGRVHRGAFAFI